ncbi:MAG: twin-arginine translocation signal domain-containing protein, partial [Alphaproteobacteria bacterium]
MVSRRKFLVGSSAIALVAAASGLALPAQAQQADDTISFGIAIRRIDTLSPIHTGGNGSTFRVIRQIYDTLVKSADGDFGVGPEDMQPALAESWTSSADAKVWTFVLRRGVQFQKGYGEMTSDDVVYVFSRHLDPEIVTQDKA